MALLFKNRQQCSRLGLELGWGSCPAKHELLVPWPWDGVGINTPISSSPCMVFQTQNVQLNKEMTLGQQPEPGRRNLLPAPAGF